MRNLNAYSSDSFVFHQDVVKSKYVTKDNPDFKTRTTAIDPVLKPLFSEYDTRFAANTLEEMNPFPLTDGQREDLKALYSYKSKPLQELKVKVTTIENNKVLSTCQCCTIGEVGTFDHLLPQDEFREFTVNPKNLFPCCTKCNGYKNANWRADGVRRFLNLYLDTLPRVQYLFVTLKIDAPGNVAAKFEVRNANGIPAPLFRLIESHYGLLHLCDRFSENIEETVTSISSQLSAGRAVGLSLPTIIEQIKAVNRANMVRFGHNFWKSILAVALADDAVFTAHYY